MTLGSFSIWFLDTVAPWLTGLTLLLVAIGYLYRRAQDSRDPYAEWIKEIQINSPDFQPPWLPDGSRNPLWIPGQTIKHTDGTVYTFPLSS